MQDMWFDPRLDYKVGQLATQWNPRYSAGDSPHHARSLSDAGGLLLAHDRVR